MTKHLSWLTMLCTAIFFVFPMLAQAQTEDYTGYLSDVASAQKGLAADGANLLRKPQSHTVACMKTLPCASSGYGILIKNEAGNYVFLEFDQNGNDLAKQLLESTNKVDDIKIEVKGRKGPDILQVESLTEGE
jgi:hypothetical protein